MTRPAIKGVLRKFLRAYTSCNSDYDGFWMLGVIAPHLPDLYIDLCARSDPHSSADPVADATQHARQRFWHQVDSAHISSHRIAQAQHWVTRAAEPAVLHYGRLGAYEFTFHARAVSDNGCLLEDQVTIVIAPHDPQRDNRRTRPHLTRRCS